MRAYAALLNGLIIALTIAVLCVRSVVICMYVNVGVVFLAVLCAAVAAFWFAFRQADPRRVARTTVAVAITCFVMLSLLFAFVYHRSLAEQPLMVLQHALHTRWEASGVLGYVLAALLSAGVGSVVAMCRRAPRL